MQLFLQHQLSLSTQLLNEFILLSQLSLVLVSKSLYLPLVALTLLIMRPPCILQLRQRFCPVPLHLLHLPLLFVNFGTLIINDDLQISDLPGIFLLA